jgi:pyridoxal phosphate enzyme (YggS family)
VDIQKNIQEIQKKISEAALRSNRKPNEISLLAVTKTLSVETIRRAYEAGLRDFGENRVQEALGKVSELPMDIRWHLVGQLQTNKINKTLGKFALIHSVDSIHLAEALSARIGNQSQDILLEVNTSGEASKTGVDPYQALEIAEKITKLSRLKLTGFMTVGPLTENQTAIREAFKRLKGLFEEVKARSWAGKDYSVLSMGMSGDFETAIEEGSTMVRIGTAIFGERH